MSEMQRVGLFAAIFMVIGLAPVMSSLAKSQMLTETSMGPSPAQAVKLEMHFSISEPNSEIIAYRDYESHPAFDGRIYRWYEKFEDIDAVIFRTKQSTDIATYIKELDELEEKVTHIRVPLAFQEELFDLRLHIDLLRKKLLKEQTDKTAEDPNTQ